MILPERGYDDEAVAEAPSRWQRLAMRGLFEAGRVEQADTRSTSALSQSSTLARDSCSSSDRWCMCKVKERRVERT
eukprot:7739-Hanusia_phi.AAC.1